MGFIKQLWYCVPAELGKGAIKGQWIRLTNWDRYKKLLEIRQPGPLLREKKKELLIMIKKELSKDGICEICVFGRIKTIGSLDRKERYARIIYPSAASDYLKEDIIGATIIVKTEQDAYRVLNALQRIGGFPGLAHRQNPRDYLKEPEKISRPELPAGYKIGITGNFFLEGFPCQVHMRIFLAKDYPIHTESRSQYLKAVWRRIKEHEAEIPVPLTFTSPNNPAMTSSKAP